MRDLFIILLSAVVEWRRR